MHRFSLSIENLPEQERFAFWREEINEQLIGVTGEAPRHAEAGFTAQIDASLGTTISRFRYDSTCFPVSRGRREIARRGWADRLWLYRETGDGAWFNHNGREYQTRRGDLIVTDPTMPFVTEARGDYNLDIWLFPRALLAPHVAATQLPPSLLISGRDGISGLVLGYLDSLAGQLARLNDADEAVVAENFCRLLAVACGRQAGEHRAALRAARLEEAKRFIGLHLADPDLTPETAAAALKISLRHLHLLFEPTGLSFAQYVLQQRLDECRAALTNPAHAGRSITDIAFAWGFNSLGTFYRNFHRAFGITPSDLRRNR